MDFINPASTDGVNLFVNIVVTLIGFLHAVLFINARKESKKKSQ